MAKRLAEIAIDAAAMNNTPKVRLATRHQYDTERDEREGAAAATGNFEPTLTEQHHKDDVDLNVIVKRYGIKDGSIPVAPMNPEHYGDFSEVVDLRTALDRVRAAEAHFQALPADVREKFDNNAAKMYTWVTNPKNSEEAVRIGLLKKEEPAAPPKDTPQ